MRKAQIKRTTAETDIKLSINLDGKGDSKIDTGCGFLDHMLTLFAKHGRFDLDVKCNGDVQVDFHHTTEDIGIVLGQAFEKALGDKKGITRYGSFILPMDEALILTAVDLSGRSFLVKELDIKANKVGDFDTELVEEFLLAFTRTANCTLHVRQLSGSNAHHIIEGVFKCLARALKQAVKIDCDAKDEIPSTKGVL
jgi:imidazoleglycerol-phosphate dehydratase